MLDFLLWLPTPALALVIMALAALVFFLIAGFLFGMVWVLERLFPTDPDVEEDRVTMALFHEINRHGGRRRRRRPGSDCSKCMENIEKFPRALE